MPDHAVYHQQQGGGGGDGLEKSWSPLQKITQEEASESLGGVWSRVELDGSRGGVGVREGEGGGGPFSAPQAHPVWDGIGDRGALVSGWRGREGQKSGPERKRRRRRRTS